MELLRLVAMFMIVMLHLDIFLLIESNNFVNQPFVCFFIYILKSLTIIGVNVFIMLSGWYGITFKWNRFYGLWFQILFFAAIGLLYDLFVNDNITNLKNFLTHLLQMDGNSYGFFQSYIILYIFSPILNKYIQSTDVKSIIGLLCAFYILQFLWGCISWGYVYYGNGYSALSFMGLYILARFARIRQIHLCLKCHQWGFLYLFVSVLSGIISYSFINYTTIYNFVYSYTSPLVIVSAFSVLAFFSRLKIQANIINQISKYCFAIYLFHMNYYILPDIINLCTNLKMHKNIGLFILYAPIICMITFTISIVLDVIRLYSWNKVYIIFNNKKTSKL